MEERERRGRLEKEQWRKTRERQVKDKSKSNEGKTSARTMEEREKTKERRGRKEKMQWRIRTWHIILQYLHSTTQHIGGRLFG